MLKLPPISLYVHFPWCVKKCPYCDFNSHQLRTSLPANEYLQTLIRDLESHHQDLQDRKFSSIFLGGGTPSLFPSLTLSKFFDYLNQHNLTDNNTEITLEANPGTIEHGKFCDYKAMGINRISLGVQSFQNDKLQILGRIHNDQNIYHAVEKLKCAGFNNFNLDLMHGLPNQSVGDAIYDLNQAIALEPTHLSWYQLTLEPNTPFAVKPPKLPDEDLLYEIETQGKALIGEQGFDQYETSAYAKCKTLQAKHNLNYWHFGDYIGIGAGAHSKISYPQQNIIKRYWKRKHPTLYISEKRFPYGQSQIMKEDRPYEFMLNALRLYNGFSTDLFEQTTGLGIETIEQTLDLAINRKLLIQNGKYFIPSKIGQRFLNDLIYLFLP
ncbi:radical SAM family heme chaperone HemW [Fastidiosibacter lacustris]|uniref:radical SAM family heme chaperone HemW n=1 Tax=Fastidiosibacter lacustris TaxID=2056695 RepID=UPI000E354A54|nr:radical SAM family heme chaperone HemW [Fastidiosibacter lacustris]